MFNRPIEWLRKVWWGLVVAYILVFVATFSLIWVVIEPIGIPDVLENLPSFFKFRVVIHLIFTLIIGAHVTLALDVIVRRTQWANSAKDQHEQFVKVLRRMAHLQKEFKVNDWKITHKILNEEGDDSLYEVLTITPLSDAIYFFVKGYSIPEKKSGDQQKLIEVTAKNLADETPLDILEVERTDKKVRYAILLDPPSTVSEPKKIAIECKRRKLWSQLLKSHRDEGTLQANHQSNTIQMEIIAPPDRRWKAFHPAPGIGQPEVDNKSNHTSRILWSIPESSPRTYAYEVFLEPTPPKK